MTSVLSRQESPVEFPTADAKLDWLYATHTDSLMHFMMRLTRGERHTAEDLVQETMLRAWRHIDAVPAHYDNSRRWLFVVGRRIFIDSMRRTDKQPHEVSLLEADMAVSRDTPESALAIQALTGAFRSLSPAHQTVLMKFYVDGYSVDEVASSLGVPVGTVKSRAHYALRALRRSLSVGG